MPSLSLSVCDAFATDGQLSQVSPFPSPSASAWSTFDWLGQLSQASPTESPSTSPWVAFVTVGQLSPRSRGVSASLFRLAVVHVGDGVWSTFWPLVTAADSPHVFRLET